MEKTRREFIKDAALVSAVVATVITCDIEKSEAAPDGETPENVRCPFFDQPLMCDGPDERGRYVCDE